MQSVSVRSVFISYIQLSKVEQVSASRAIPRRRARQAGQVWRHDLQRGRRRPARGDAVQDVTPRAAAVEPRGKNILGELIGWRQSSLIGRHPIKKHPGRVDAQNRHLYGAPSVRTGWARFFRRLQAVFLFYCASTKCCYECRRVIQLPRLLDVVAHK